MTIRHAIAADAGSIATCLLQAMESIVFDFTGQKNTDLAYRFMHYFTQRENNQYSWQNCWVAEIEGRIAGAINVYDGATLHFLRQPVVDYVCSQYHTDFSPEDETSAGEWYIDSLGVLPAYRCRGIGTALLQFVINEYVQRRGETLGLLVEKENVVAKRLYLKLGFRTIGNRTLFGKEMAHLVCTASFNH